MQIVDDPTSDMHGMTISSLPADVYLEAVRSEDDVGSLLRSHYLVECACQNLCHVLYADYARLQHDSLSKHLRALRAFGFNASALRMADVVSKHRAPIAHINGREITQRHVDELNEQSSGVINIPGTLIKAGRMNTIDGGMVELAKLPLRTRYVMLSMSCAIAIDYMAEKRKPAAA